MDYYRVEYLKHSLVSPVERQKAEVTKVELIELLNNGSITLLKAEIVHEVG